MAAHVGGRIIQRQPALALSGGEGDPSIGVIAQRRYQPHGEVRDLMSIVEVHRTAPIQRPTQASQRITRSRRVVDRHAAPSVARHGLLSPVGPIGAAAMVGALARRLQKLVVGGHPHVTKYEPGEGHRATARRMEPLYRSPTATSGCALLRSRHVRYRRRTAHTRPEDLG